MDVTIKSFEQGAEIAGDILTSGKVKRKVKIGLLTMGYFEYWRMYPELKEKVSNDIADITKEVLSRFDNVVQSGLVDTLDGADEAGKLFLRENVDVVLLVYGTYMPDFITLAALDYVAHKPLIMFSMQTQENIDKKGDYQCSLQNSGIIGISQFTGTMAKLSRKYSVVVGSKNDARAYDKIAKHMRALQAVIDLKESNIGIIGHVFRGMYDIELSKTFLKSVFGVNIILIQSSHLLDIWQEVGEKETLEECARLKKRFKTKHITDTDIFNAVKLAIAMRRISEKFKLDAMCFLDQHFVQKQVLTSARIGASLLMEQTDMSVNCEGDLGGLVTMMLMRSISGKQPLMAEWGEYDTELNACMLIGHGIGTPDLAASDSEVTLTRTPEEWGFEGAGMNYELIVKPGAATIAHIMEGVEGYRLLITPCESLNHKKFNYDELHAFVKVKKPVKEYLEEIFEFGVSHHCILGMGDITEELNLAAKFLNIKAFNA